MKTFKAKHRRSGEIHEIDATGTDYKVVHIPYPLGGLTEPGFNQRYTRLPDELESKTFSHTVTSKSIAITSPNDLEVLNEPTLRQIQPGYLMVSVNEYAKMKEDGVQMHVKEFQDLLTTIEAEVEELRKVECDKGGFGHQHNPWGCGEVQCAYCSHMDTGECENSLSSEQTAFYNEALDDILAIISKYKN